tara:strand:- start:131 stop:412 length:282 start_codon:yes stop_codon:yes gene_type:complete
LEEEKEAEEEKCNKSCRVLSVSSKAFFNPFPPPLRAKSIVSIQFKEERRKTLVFFFDDREKKKFGLLFCFCFKKKSQQQQQKLFEIREGNIIT